MEDHCLIILMKSRSCKLFFKLLLLIPFLLVLISFFHHIPTLLSPTPTPLFPTEALPTKTGYLSVNPTTSSAIFYAFYEAQNPISPLSETPLIIWLQGGPGCSSMVGNFFELGPWRVTSHKTFSSETFALEPNPGSWNRKFGLLFLDNPIGAGFSIAMTPKEIPRDQLSVAKHLFAAITSFIELDPLLFKSRPLYFAGESYAGKYVPAIGYYILKANANLPVSQQVNLGGVAIGNGLTDPITQVATHATHAYYSGLINERQKSVLEKAQWEAIKLTKMRKWRLATNARSEVLRMLQGMTGLATLHDFSKKAPYKTEMVFAFLRKKEVRKALGLNTSKIYDLCSNDVATALHDDFMKSVKFMVEILVKKSKVLLYQGHFDLRDSVLSTEAWVKTIKWEGLNQFLMANRKVWRVNGELAGYVQKWGNLSHVVVLGAGHLVPTDQAVSSQAMMEDWILERMLLSHEEKEVVS
ncbi:serine carboxypeptidase-like 50 [Castanea sativa]|uniref:serine carboxypeptidase-like 50 n=1 Tax=Castanea sativa TaxID=21020 RepID=UPI003F65014B